MSTISHSLRDQKEPNRQQLFSHSFALPDGQIPLTDIPAVMSLSNPADDDSAQEDEVYAGRLTLTEKFLCFESMDRRSCREALPLYCVRRVERLNTKRSGVFALAVVVWHGMRIILQLNALRTQCEAFCSLLRDNLRAQLPNMKQLKPFVAKCFSEVVLNPELSVPDQEETREAGPSDSEKQTADDPALNTPPPYHAGLGARFKYPGDARKLREKSKMKLWRDYLRIHGRNLTCTRYPQFLRLVQVGLPSSLRGEIWELTSGSIYNRFERQGEYERILKENEGVKTTATDEIEKDLHRSLPEYAGFQSPVGIDSLRRVLYAFSFKNPELGYTQGLNILAAAFLIYCSEEQTYFLLGTLCDRLLPGYYTQSMAGTILDRRVFEHLVQRSLPMIHEHLVKTDIQLSVASLPWFLSLYINSMPMVFAFRIVDCFMAMGPKVLFQVALAILKINGEELLSVTDDGAFISVMRKYFASLGESAHPDAVNPKHRSITNFQELLVVAFREFGVITDETIASERRRFRQEIVEEIELFAKRSAVRQLNDLGRFSKDQAGMMYDHIVEAIYRSRHERQAREAALAVAGTPDPSALSEKDRLAAATMIEPAPPTSQDFKEMRIDYDTFKIFLSEVTTWARDEYTVSSLNGLHERTEKRVADHDFVKRIFAAWDSEGRNTLSFQDIISGMDPIVFSEGDVLSSINWFFKLHAGSRAGAGKGTGAVTAADRDSLTKDEVLRLSESLLYLFRNEAGEGYLAAVSQLISQAFNVGGEKSPHGHELERESSAALAPTAA
ncbi:unnamed protein product [Parajaminaea phylloscopi]